MGALGTIKTLMGISLLSLWGGISPIYSFHSAPSLFGMQAHAADSAKPASSAQITEAEVNVLLNHMKSAVEKRDAKALVAYFTPDAKIEIALPFIMGGKQSFTRASYENMLAEGWTALEDSDYTYAVKNINIKLYPHKDQALVSDETHESFLLAGKRVLSVAKENMLIVRHQGQLKVKILKGKVKLNP